MDLQVQLKRQLILSRNTTVLTAFLRVIFVSHNKPPPIIETVSEKLSEAKPKNAHRSFAGGYEQNCKPAALVSLSPGRAGFLVSGDLIRTVYL